MDTTAEELADRVVAALLGFADVLAIHVGDRMGWYGSLAVDGPASPQALAQRTGTQERYAREWLEQQAVGGLLSVAVDGEGERIFHLPDATREVLTDPHSLLHMTPFARLFAAVGPVLPRLLDAYRHGAG